MEFNKIIVPIDFSDCSLLALRYGIKFAKKFNAHLLIKNTYHIPVPAAEMTLTINPDLVEDYKQEANEKFKDVMEEIPELEEVSFKFKVEMAFAIDAILNSVEEDDIDLIIMGTKGASGIAEIVIGSNTSGVIRRASCPVIAIPENIKEFRLKKIVFASDYHRLENPKVLEPLALIAETFDAEVHILNVNPKPSEMSREEAEEALNLEHVFKNVHHSFQFSSEENVEKGISNYIEDNEIDLLTMVPRRHNLLEQLFKGSLTRKFAHHTRVPLLTFHE